MPFQANDLDERAVTVLLVLTVLLTVGLALGVGLSHTRRPAQAAAAPAPVATVATTPVADVVPLAADDPSVVVDEGMVRFYFAPGQANMPAGALLALQDAIAAARSGQRLVLSGFHDASGDPEKNAELARQRALALRDALLAAGVLAIHLELRKPVQSVGSGNAAEARRVDVMIGG